MAMVLFEKETIHTEQVEMLMQGKSAEEVIAAMDAAEAATTNAHPASEEPKAE